MTIHRRSFVRAGLGAAALCTVAPRARALRSLLGEARDPLHILMLGGTGFLGPHIVNHALARGHRVTLFNRGRTNADLFPQLEKLRGNRDPDLHADTDDPDSPVGLTQLRGRSFDAVIDTSAYFPRHVRASASLLAPHVGHYHMVSSVSAYATHDTPGADESDPLATLDDPTIESRDPVYYGPLKAACEHALGEILPDRHSITRPGLIVGPRDQTDRFTYWPWRLQRGGEVLAPGDGDDPVQIIDVRDLARFIVHLIETRSTGPFNAVGPAERITMKQMLEQVRTGIDARCTLTWVDADFLQAHGVQAWQHMTCWVPRDAPEYSGFAQRSNKRAVSAGLTFTDIPTTSRDTLAWLRTQDADRQTHLRAGLPPDREQAVLNAWKNR